MTRVWHFNGKSGVRHDAVLTRTGDDFTLDFAGSDNASTAFSELVPMSDGVFGLKGRRGWRIGFIDPVPAGLTNALPRGAKYGGWIDRLGIWRASAAFAALSAVVVYVTVQAPDWLSPLVPPSLEAKMGDAMFGDFGGRICNGPGGQAAVDALVRRIEPNPAGLKVHVVNIDMVNAVALPGGHILIFNGLLKSAESADELAGVVGHEIGHVRNRDVVQALLRQMGLSVLLGGVNSNVGGSVNGLIASTYSRKAESGADSYAIAALNAAKVSLLGTAGFFARMAKDEKLVGKAKDALSYMSSHPLSEAREKTFRLGQFNGVTSPALSPAQWKALQTSCKNDPNVTNDTGLFF